MKTDTAKTIRESRARRGVELRAVTDAEKAQNFIGALEGTIPFNTDSAQLRDRALNNGRPFIEQIAPDAFKRSIAEDKDIMGFAGHTDAPLEAFARIGENMTVTQDANALTWRALIPDTVAGRDLCTLAEKKIISGTSFEFAARSTAGEKWEKRGTQDVRTITDARLFAVNPVAWPAYDDSSLTVDMRSIRRGSSKRDYLYSDDDFSYGDASLTPDAALATSALGYELAALCQCLEYLRENPDGALAKYAKKTAADAASDVTMLVTWLSENGATPNPDYAARALKAVTEAREKLSPTTITDDGRERRLRHLQLRSA